MSRLAAAGIEFVLVGGLAAVAQGAPLTTFDVDIVPARTEENVDALLAVLAELHARYRGRPRGQILPPSRSALLGPGHSLLITDLGPLDVLGAIEGGRTYDDLVADTIEVSLGGHPVKLLELAVLVELKRSSAHSRDRAMLPVLEETLRRGRSR